MGIPLGFAPLLYFGSAHVLRERISGRPVAWDFAAAELHAVVGEKANLRATVWNFTSHPIRVLGAKASCGCLRAMDLPQDIPPGRIIIRFELEPLRAEEMEYHVELYVDAPAMTRISKRIPVSIRDRATTGRTDGRTAGDV
jgi:hypothetical protein